MVTSTPLTLPTGEPLWVTIRAGYANGQRAAHGGPYLIKSNVGLSMVGSVHRGDFWLRNVTECCGARSYNVIQGSHRRLHQCLTCFKPTTPGFDLPLNHSATRAFVMGQVRHDPVGATIIVDALMGMLANLWEDHENVLAGRTAISLFGMEVR